MESANGSAISNQAFQEALQRARQVDTHLHPFHSYITSLIILLFDSWRRRSPNRQAVAALPVRRALPLQWARLPVFPAVKDNSKKVCLFSPFNVIIDYF